MFYFLCFLLLLDCYGDCEKFRFSPLSWGFLFFFSKTGLSEINFLCSKMIPSFFRVETLRISLDLRLWVRVFIWLRRCLAKGLSYVLGTLMFVVRLAELIICPEFLNSTDSTGTGCLKLYYSTFVRWSLRFGETSRTKSEKCCCKFSLWRSDFSIVLSL